MAQQDKQQPIPEDLIYDSLEQMKVYNGGMSRTAVYSAIKDLGFPQPYQFGRRIVRWKRSEVRAWMANRARGTRMTPAGRARQQQAAQEVA